MKRARFISEHYTKQGNVLGAGTTSDVFCAKRKLDNEKVAIKRLKELPTEDIQNSNLVPREISMMEKLHHPNILSVLELVRDKSGRAYIVLEWMKHDLRGLLRSHHSNHFSRAQVKGYAYQIVQGIAFCHANNVVHLDLKPDNILISSRGVAKITDFGLAEHCNSNLKHDKLVVTRWYRPLEVSYGIQTFAPSIDMWSIGCIIGELLLNHVLLPGSDDIDQMTCIYNLCGTPAENGWIEALNLPKYVMPHFQVIRNIDESLRTKNKNKRASYFTKLAISVLDSLLTLDPTKRMSAQELCDHPYFVDESPKPLTSDLMPLYEESYFGPIRGSQNK